jgi:coatomer protein complex subunit epsilon
MGDLLFPVYNNFFIGAYQVRACVRDIAVRHSPNVQMPRFPNPSSKTCPFLLQQVAINEASDLQGLSDTEATERDCYMYRAYIALGSYQVSNAEGEEDGNGNAIGRLLREK